MTVSCTTVCVRSYCNIHTDTHQGIACNLDSNAFKKLNEATKEVMGESKPYSITGSLPLVGDLQEAGFDVQVGNMKNCWLSYSKYDAVTS